MARAQDIGIDLGTSHVRIFMEGSDIVLDEPAVVAQERSTGMMLAVGDHAYRLVGRTPGSVDVRRPMHQGTISSTEMLRVMLSEFIRTVIGRRRILSRPSCVLALPSGVSEADRHVITSIVIDSGARKVNLIDRCVAAALGVGVPFQEAYGSMIVYMGAGATYIDVLAMNEKEAQSSHR